MLAAEEGFRYVFYIFLDYEFLVFVPATRLQHKTVRRVTWGIVSEMKGHCNHTSSYSQYMFMAGVTFLKNAT
jgi:hypothetical protein